MPMYKRSLMVLAALAACILGGLFYAQPPAVLAPAEENQQRKQR